MQTLPQLNQLVMLCHNCLHGLQSHKSLLKVKLTHSPTVQCRKSIKDCSGFVQEQRLLQEQRFLQEQLHQRLQLAKDNTRATLSTRATISEIRSGAQFSKPLLQKQWHGQALVLNERMTFLQVTEVRANLLRNKVGDPRLHLNKTRVLSKPQVE